MRHIITLIIITITFGYYLQAQIIEEVDKKGNKIFTIDSVFLIDFKADTIINIDNLKNPEYGKNEQVYSLLKEKAKYFEIKKFSLDNDITGRIVSAYSSGLTLDGILNILFFVTYDKSDKEIDSIRLAKYELVSDVYSLETATIIKSNIKIERKYSTIGFNEKIIENYTINKNGRIIKNIK